MHLSDQELENEVVFSEQLDDEDKSLKDVEDLEEDENDNKQKSKDLKLNKEFKRHSSVWEARDTWNAYYALCSIQTKGLKVTKEDQMLIGMMVDRLDGQQARWSIGSMVDRLDGQQA